MGQPETNAAQLGGLQGVVLALVVAGGNQQLTGYRLATLVKRRLGPAWRGSPRSVYKALERLEKEGLVLGHTGRGGRATIYSATERGEVVLAQWMASAAREPMRLDLPAKIAVSRPEDAPRLLRALDDYELECFERLKRSSDAEVQLGSWAGLAMNLALAALDEGLQAELRWVTLARRWIEDYPSQAGLRNVADAR
jgi:DNA-binding PadR family transcriptional regulator